MEQMSSRKMDDMFFYTSAASTEGENYLTFFFSPTGVYRWRNNPELLNEIQESFGEFDQEKRQQNFTDIQHRLNDEAVIIPLWLGEDIWGARKDIDFKPRYDESMEVVGIKLGKTHNGYTTLIGAHTRYF
ncbi:hypothetical protein KSU66_08065 [Sporosarcina sp. G11-34]|nr:hypothetical protein [Sporosarcina sp. G11-34]